MPSGLAVLDAITDPTRRRILDAWRGGERSVPSSTSGLEPSLTTRPEPWDRNAFAVARAHHADLGLAAPLDAP
jgi:hypothetical protein